MVGWRRRHEKRLQKGKGGGSIMRKIAKEEDSAREEWRVTGCQPRMQSIFGRIKGTVHDFNYKLMLAYSIPLTAAVHM